MQLTLETSSDGWPATVGSSLLLAGEAQVSPSEGPCPNLVIWSSTSRVATESKDPVLWENTAFIQKETSDLSDSLKQDGWCWIQRKVPAAEILKSFQTLEPITITPEAVRHTDTPAKSQTR